MSRKIGEMIKNLRCEIQDYVLNLLNFLFCYLCIVLLRWCVQLIFLLPGIAFLRIAGYNFTLYKGEGEAEDRSDQVANDYTRIYYLRPRSGDYISRYLDGSVRHLNESSSILQITIGWLDYVAFSLARPHLLVISLK